MGRYRTDLTPTFWSALAAGLGCDLSLVKVRGGNAHHQLESAFKAFARVFRAALDALADGGSHGCAAVGAPPVASGAPPAAPRCAERRRATKETTIEVRVDLDAPWQSVDQKAGAATAWDGETKTATKMRATVQAAPRHVEGSCRAYELTSYSQRYRTSRCTHDALTVTHSRCTHGDALTLHSRCTHAALTMHSQCTHDALTMHSLTMHSR